MGKPSNRFVWRAEDSLRVSAGRLGKALAKAHPGLHRTAQGLIEALPAEGRVRLIDAARKLAPVLIDRQDVRVMRGGQVVGDLPPDRSLKVMGFGPPVSLVILPASGGLLQGSP
jgi:hypothetical protein